MLGNFKKGDRVRIVTDYSYQYEHGSEDGTVVKVSHPHKPYPLTVILDCGQMVDGEPGEFRLIDSIEKTEVANKSNMGALQKLTILAKTLVDSDLKTLLKAGWLNSSLELTSEGEDAIFAHYLTTNKAELAKLAKAEMKENRRSKDCDDDDDEDVKGRK